jgi:hypothetical protein
MVTPALWSRWLTVLQSTLSSAPIWRRVQPWAYKSAARLTSTRATVTACLAGGHAQAMTAVKRTGARAEVLAKIGRGDEQDAARSGWPLPPRFRPQKRS